MDINVEKMENWLDYKLVIGTHEKTGLKTVYCLKDDRVVLDMTGGDEQMLNTVKTRLLFMYMLYRPKQFADLLSFALESGTPYGMLEALKKSLSLEALDLPESITGDGASLRLFGQQLFVNG